MAYVTSYGVGQYAPSAASEAHCFVLPKNYTGGGRGTIYGHGYTSSALEGTFTSFVGKIAEKIGPILVTDLGGPATFGNDAAIARAADARSFFISKYGVDSKVNIFAGSMGVLNLLNWAQRNPGQVNAMALTIPATSLAALYPTFQTQIDAAYGGTSAYNSARAAHSPIEYAMNAWPNIPMKLWNSTNDPTVLPATVDAFAERYLQCERASLGAVGHDTSSINPFELQEFFFRYP